MSSVVFQPLLHDPLGWKSSNSTYADHYKWKKYRSTSKDKKVSTYGQQYQRQLLKQQPTNNSLPTTFNEEQTVKRVILVKKNEDNHQGRPMSYRCSTLKTPPEQQPVYTVEYKQRPASTNADLTCNSRVTQRPPTAPATAEEKYRSSTAFEARRSPKEEKDKTPIDPNNDDSRHWLTYPNPKTPQYIIDIKQRLGQTRGLSKLGRPSSASSTSAKQQQQQQTPAPTIRPSSASTQSQQKQENDNQHNFLTFNIRDTPEDLRVIRHRIDKQRYNPSLDNYPPRPQTCPVRTNDVSKGLTPQESEDDQLPPLPSSPKTDVWIVDDDRKTTLPDNESSSVFIQMVDCDGLPNEYVDALETANAAQAEYQRSMKMNAERRPDNPVYRLPTTIPDYKSDSFVAYQNQQQSTTMNNPLRQVARTSQNDFGTWVRTATERERASAMKILHDVLNQPVVGYDNQIKQKTLFKQAPAPPPVRASSATRKLGRTRTQHQFPCEICEKLLIKRHVWDLSGSETLTCPHHPQGIKSPAIQVRA